MKERADKVLVFCGQAKNRQAAQALIMAGVVFSGGQRIEKPGQLISLDEEIFIKKTLPYVSRGGLKLEDALKCFNLSVQGKTAADLGASTGGFADCLLQHGARKVYAVDVNTRQIDWSLQNDPRVVLIRKNARYLHKSDFPDTLDIVTMDLSFISILKVLPAVREFLDEGVLLCLIKPQFEAGRGKVGKGGVVRDPALHEEVLSKVIGEADKLGYHVGGLIMSSVRGQKGNREFFISWVLKRKSLTISEVQKAIKEAVWNERN